ncbi:MAG: bifunctional DNA-formamidopyrimidine glycosylase/DNA-(apurinic or apyrimidinic site) lyase, partial [Gemmatimonadaceae bacterium]|nr:bifunctional DNA-formamidopyrimidine glycosylase/DNA-(apurinic or apyrimidinic site) lyase [Gemmatimonadaceae bacterium]
MPELPETETIARDLDAALRGAVIARTVVRHPDVVRAVPPDALDAALRGAAIAQVWRRAKLVVLDLLPDARASRPVLAVQPRFTGALLLDAAPTDDPYVCLIWTLTDGRTLAYRDVRRLGTVALFDDAGWHTYEGALGPEPLDPALTPTEFSAYVRHSTRPIKAVLMDQRTLAGVGNIYATEALWGAALDPSRRACELSLADTTRLLDVLRDVLLRAIAARGTSFRDYRDAHGARGTFVEQLQAYGRAGQPCRRCGGRLVGTDAVDGR